MSGLAATLVLLAAVVLLTVSQLVGAHWLFEYLTQHDEVRYSEALRLKEATNFCVHEMRAATQTPTPTDEDEVQPKETT